MSRSMVVPLFPNAPPTYDQRYMAEVVRAFSIYLQQYQNPGDWRASTLTLTALPEDDYGLEPGAVFQQNGILKVSIQGRPHVRGVSASVAVGTVTVTT